MNDEGLRVNKLQSHTIRIGIVLALALSLTDVAITNTGLYSQLALSHPELRDISSACGGLCCACLALLALYRPRVLRALPLMLTAVIASNLMLWVLSSSNLPYPLLVMATILRAAAKSWLFVLVALALTRLNPRYACTLLAIAIGIGILLSAWVVQHPAANPQLLAYLQPVLVGLLIHRPTAPLIASIRKEPPLADVRLLQPHVFVPYTHTIFALFLVYWTVFGFTLSYQTNNHFPLQLGIYAVPFLIIAAVSAGHRFWKHQSAHRLWHAAQEAKSANTRIMKQRTYAAPACAEKELVSPQDTPPSNASFGPYSIWEKIFRYNINRTQRELIDNSQIIDGVCAVKGGQVRRIFLRELDLMHLLSVIFILAGFWLLVAPNNTQMMPAHLAHGILQIGDNIFYLLMFLLICAAQAKSPLVVLPLCCMLRATMSFGTVIGANMGHLANRLGQTTALGSDASHLLLGTGMLTMVICTCVFLSKTSISRMIDALQAPQDLEENIQQTALHTPQYTDTFDVVCTRLKQEYRLTDREFEVFVLLARGRNTQIIQERLYITRNTIKTHVKAIYQKLSVHSQQEILDVVEAYMNQELSCYQTADHLPNLNQS